jgi:hypothetical protein
MAWQHPGCPTVLVRKRATAQSTTGPFYRSDAMQTADTDGDREWYKTPDEKTGAPFLIPHASTGGTAPLYPLVLV